RRWASALLGQDQLALPGDAERVERLAKADMGEAVRAGQSPGVMFRHRLTPLRPACREYGHALQGRWGEITHRGLAGPVPAVSPGECPTDLYLTKSLRFVNHEKNRP